ncbi:MAG: Mov34/MPN/PAD-1 family protein [Ktedonobacteraceae bacterium]
MRKHANAQVTVSLDARNTLFNDVCQRPHIEACGILLGHIDSCGNWNIEQAYPLRNIFNSPVYFEFAPEDLLAVELDHPGKIVGVYHSHPTGFAVASSTDHENMRRVNVEQQIPWVWLIISGPFDETFEPGQKSSMIAYHYYEELELQEIGIEFG